MGCLFTKGDIFDNWIFEVIKVDENGRHMSRGKLELREREIIYCQANGRKTKWDIRQLRRYGCDANYFIIESGRKTETGHGVFFFRCHDPKQIFFLVQARINLGFVSGHNISSLGETLSFKRRIPPTMHFSHEAMPIDRGGIFLPSVPVAVSDNLERRIVPHSIALPQDNVPLIPPLPRNPFLNHNVYANDEVIAAFNQNLHENNNNEAHLSPSPEQLYLHASQLVFFQKGDPDLTGSGYLAPVKEVTSPSYDIVPSYMNLIPSTAENSPRSPKTPPPCLMWDKPGNSKHFYVNINGNQAMNPLNYITLDLASSGDSPKSPTTSLLLDGTNKPVETYADIDFKKTVALSHSVNPNFDTDNESSRKTRHSSSLNSFSGLDSSTGADKEWKQVSFTTQTGNQRSYYSEFTDSVSRLSSIGHGYYLGDDRLETLRAVGFL